MGVGAFAFTRLVVVRVEFLALDDARAEVARVAGRRVDLRAVAMPSTVRARTLAPPD
jgi:hypothetical protein